MTDRELLELAARAARLHHCGWDEEDQCITAWFDDPPDKLEGGAWGDWNPLNDDGQALRLANDTDTSIEFGYCLDDAPVVRCGYYAERENWPQECNFPDPYKATRRAIVEAVARKQQEYEAATARRERLK